MSGMRYVVIVNVALAVAAVAACKSSGEATGSTCPTASTLTYDNFGKAFIAANCLSCHSAKSGRGDQPILDDVTGIRNATSEIDKSAASGPNATNDGMPTDKDVATAERTKLGEWLACGAP